MMHAEAAAFVREWCGPPRRWHRVLELGSRNVNGGARSLIDADYYLGIDKMDGPGVDVVADARTWSGDPAGFDLAICTETFEHEPRWWELVASMAANLRPGGRAVITTARDPRPPHSSVDGGPLRDGEHYANVTPADLEWALTGHFTSWRIDLHRADLRAVAWR